MNFQPCRRRVLEMGVGAMAVTALAACSADLAQPEEGAVLASIQDIPEGQAIPVIIGDVPIIVGHDSGGTFRAFSAICPHQGCKVLLDGDDPGTLVCPCHYSEFDTFSGKRLTGPAEEDLPEFPVVVRDGKIIAA